MSPDPYSKLNPSKDLTVIDLLKFELRKVQKCENPLTSNPDDFLDQNPPNLVGLSETARVPRPTLKIVEAIEKRIQSTGNENYPLSIQCAHLACLSPTTLPRSIVPFWKALYEAEEAVGGWKFVVDSLHEYRVLGKKTEDLEDMLSKLTWGGKLNGYSRNGTTSISNLPRLLMSKWQTDEQMNLMLDLLRMEVEQASEFDDVEVQSTWFFERLRQGWSDAGGYVNAKNFEWIRRRGNEMATGQLRHLALAINLNRNHWVSVVVDVEAKEIRYGDSLGNSIPNLIKDVLAWWTKNHTGVTFASRDLPIGRQSDGVSCGFFAWNALAHGLLPMSYDLAEGAQVVDVRLDLLRKAIRVHLDNTVSVVSQLSFASGGSSLTFRTQTAERRRRSG